MENLCIVSVPLKKYMARIGSLVETTDFVSNTLLAEYMFLSTRNFTQNSDITYCCFSREILYCSEINVMQVKEDASACVCVEACRNGMLWKNS